jgi:putative adenylate-forming enzyme
MIRGPLVAAQAFARTRWLAARLRSREDLEAYQRRRLQALLRRAVRDFGFYRSAHPSRWTDLPEMDKATMLAHFADLNRPRLEIAALRAALARGEERLAGHVIGQSTGTSGNRGYYVITEMERFRWLGTLLAKALPDALWRRHRVALALPGLSRLYRAASSGSRIALAFFDLGQGVETWQDEFAAFQADTVVGTPKVLRRLAELGRLRAARVFSGAEVLDPLDRQVIEAATGARVREIYMATEGLFGVACPHGTLHLAEDVVHFEWQRPAGGSALWTPLVTDFTRQAQAMIRYRMNDLLALDDAPCRCGSPFQAVRSVEGRHDDSFWLVPRQGGGPRFITPDVIRNAIVDSSPLIRDFRAVQNGAARIEVALPDDVPLQVHGEVGHALERKLASMGIAGVEVAVRAGIEVPLDRKLRRVRRDWSPAQGLQSQS